MFKDLVKFEIQRSISQAIGFYLVWGLTGIALVFILVAGIALLFPIYESTAFNFGLGTGAVIAGLICTLLTFLVLKSKDRLSNFSSIIFLIVTLGLGLLGGAALGMIVPAYLTTTKKV